MSNINMGMYDEWSLCSVIAKSMDTLKERIINVARVHDIQEKED
jgi:hypothetical protein